MKSTKVKSLKARGYSVGDIDEFLNLSPEEVALIEMKISLSKNFQILRKKEKLTQVQAAKILKTSQSRLAKMESGHPSVSLDLLVKGIIALGGSKKMIGKMF